MEPNLADMCTHLDTCKDIWEYVHLLFSNNLTRMYDLTSEFFHLKQEDMSVTDYFAALKRVHEELNAIQPLSTSLEVMQKQREQMVVLRFLAGLKPEFEAVRAQILGGADLPTLAETYARVMRTVSACPTAVVPSDNKFALLSTPQYSPGGGRGNRRRGGRNSRGGRSGRGPRPQCTHCGLPGHIKEKCWDLVGRPPYHAHTAASTTDTPGSSSTPADHLHSIPPYEYTQFLQYQATQ